MSRRFDVVVWNYERLPSFFDNFDRIRSFHPSRDRLTVVSASPSDAERELIEFFERKHDLPVRYLTRRNRGIDQLARAEYFTGEVGELEDNTSYAYIFQMQDHYLDTRSEFSHWGEELGGRIKGDVVPDGITFDLDEIEDLTERFSLKALFCDRNEPCFVAIDKRRYVAPCGGNFIIRTRDVRAPDVQEACRQLIRSCDDTYSWAVYAEFKWGMIFFSEGEAFFDLKRRRLFREWNEADFYVAPDNFPALRRLYEERGPRAVLRRAAHRAQSSLPRARAALRI